jgi:hypothetical protein
MVGMLGKVKLRGIDKVGWLFTSHISFHKIIGRQLPVAIRATCRGNCELSCSDVGLGHNFVSACIRLEADPASKRIVDFEGWHESLPSSMLRLGKFTIGLIN